MVVHLIQGDCTPAIIPNTDFGGSANDAADLANDDMDNQDADLDIDDDDSLPRQDSLPIEEDEDRIPEEQLMQYTKGWY